MECIDLILIYCMSRMWSEHNSKGLIQFCVFKYGFVEETPLIKKKDQCLRQNVFLDLYCTKEQLYFSIRNDVMILWQKSNFTEYSRGLEQLHIQIYILQIGFNLATSCLQEQGAFASHKSNGNENCAMQKPITRHVLRPHCISLNITWLSSDLQSCDTESNKSRVVLGILRVSA